MSGHVTVPNGITTTSLVLGFVALLIADDRLGVAVVLVLVAAVLDGIDGALARRAGGDRTFGAQLDTLTDALCFTVVPAYALHAAVADDAPVLGAAVGATVVVAGAWRLARFPLVQQSGCFVGLPTPAAGALLLLLLLWAPVGLAVVGAVALAALMVSTMRFPTVLAAAASVRPAGRAQGPLAGRSRPRLVPRVLGRERRERRRSSRRPTRRGTGRARKVLRALEAGGVRRWHRR